MPSNGSGAQTVGAVVPQACPSCDKKFALSPVDARPIMLQCLHRFCGGCISKFDTEAKEGGKGLACISFGCNERITSAVSELPVDTVSLRVHGGVSAKPLCGVCEEDAATTWCNECANWYCDDCRDCHPKKGKMKGHTFVHIEEHQASTDTTSTIPDIMCRKHPDQPIKVYCGDCGVAACLQCGITQHNGHSILELEAAKEEQLPVMASLVTAVQEGVPKAAAAVTDLQDAVKQLRANKVAADAAVEASFRKKAQILLARKKKVLKTIETIEVEKKQVLEDRITEFETTTESSEGGTAVAECILEHGSPAEIMIARPSLTRGLEKLIKEHQTLLAPKHKDIKLDFVDTMPDLEAQLDAFGKIAAARVDAAKCTVVGDSAGLDDSTFTVGAAFSFSITVVDDEGASVENAAQLAKATLIVPGESTVVASAQLTDGSKGSGVVAGTCIAPKVAGKYALSVTVDGTPVQSSPFAINVTTTIEFSGIKLESDGVSVKDLVASGWTLAHQKLYNYGTKVEELDALQGKKFLVAARKTGADILTVAAMGDKEVVLKRTTSRSEAYEHNGAYWYCGIAQGGNSFGFAPNGTVALGCPDTHDKASPYRLSWLMTGGCGGWRAGSTTGIHGSTEWEMLIFTI